MICPSSGFRPNSRSIPFTTSSFPEDDNCAPFISLWVAGSLIKYRSKVYILLANKRIGLTQINHRISLPFRCSFIIHSEKKLSGHKFPAHHKVLCLYKFCRRLHFFQTAILTKEYSHGKEDCHCKSYIIPLIQKETHVILKFLTVTESHLQTLHNIFFSPESSDEDVPVNGG